MDLIASCFPHSRLQWDHRHYFNVYLLMRAHRSHTFLVIFTLPESYPRNCSLMVTFYLLRHFASEMVCISARFLHSSGSEETFVFELSLSSVGAPLVRTHKHTHSHAPTRPLMPSFTLALNAQPRSFIRFSVQLHMWYVFDPVSLHRKRLTLIRLVRSRVNEFFRKKRSSFMVAPMNRPFLMKAYLKVCAVCSVGALSQSSIPHAVLLVVVAVVAVVVLCDCCGDGCC
jgi:hypothetical protein